MSILDESIVGYLLWMMVHKAAESYPSRQMARPLESRQEYLRQEREQKFRERTEYVITRRLNEDTQWISEQARLHHMEERGRSRQEPGQLPAGHITDQRHAHQDPVTVSMLDPADDESTPVTNGTLAAQKIPGQNLLQLEHHGQPQEDEEEEVATLLGLQESQSLDTMTVGPHDMELDIEVLDDAQSELTEFVGPKDEESRGTRGPGAVNSLDYMCQGQDEQVDISIPDSRRDTSASEKQPECHGVSGQVSEPNRQTQTLARECHKPDNSPLCGVGPAANEGYQSREAPTGSMHYNTTDSPQGKEEVATRHVELDTQELQYHWEAVGDSGGDIRGESSQAGCADSGSRECISDVEETVGEDVTSLDSDEPVSQSNPELAVGASPEIVWISSQVDDARKSARDAVGPHFFLVIDNLLYHNFQAKKDVHDF